MCSFVADAGGDPQWRRVGIQRRAPDFSEIVLGILFLTEVVKNLFAGSEMSRRAGNNL